MNNGFFAMASRMKYINRWALMRNEHSENLCEHSFEVAVIAHALAVIGNKRFGKNINGERAALIGLYHDTPETLTGDMPTPVKYQNEEICNAFKSVEAAANRDLLAMLPDDLREFYRQPIEESDMELKPLVKAADKLAALIKCMDERKAGNAEFICAEATVKEAIHEMKMDEAESFMNEFLPAFECTLDEMRQ